MFSPLLSWFSNFLASCCPVQPASSYLGLLNDNDTFIFQTMDQIALVLH